MATSSFSISSLPYPFSKKDLKIGISVAEWNSHITGPLLEGGMRILESAGFSSDQIVVIKVPGAFELPLSAQWLLDNGCDAAICFGCIIRGETPHFDFVSKATTDGILDLALKSGKPVIFGVLTTNDETQALERIGGKHGHKGEEAAETALWMLALKQHIHSN
ncbi:MAG: 6,7-dimethyl-8-ribityllumazine synthase [Bacteroidetes bacterium]|nr:6,7-dimethyl-8-ribityllumazine synthase [Bacteroidota bacterium]